MHVLLCSSCCDGVVKLYGQTLQRNDGGDKVLGGAMVGVPMHYDRHEMNFLAHYLGS
jgi:hypothetical protein